MDSLRKKGLEHEPNHHGSRHREVYRADAGDANRWKHAAQPDDNIWDNELK